jgi:hypothetical protein
MAEDWKDYGSPVGYTGYLDGSTKCTGFIKVQLQYDANSATPTSVNIRFKISSDKPYNWTSDEYFIFWKPNQKSMEQFFRVKTGGAGWPGYSKTVTLLKTYSGSGFVIPEYWICHTGAICNGKTVFNSSDDGYLYMTYGDASTKTIYWYFTNNRKNFKTTVSSFTMTINGTVATSVERGKVTITDNGDNTFTLNTTAGKAGTLNPITKTELTWGFDSYDEDYFTDGTKIDITDYFDSANDRKTDGRKVYAKRIDYATYGNNGVYPAMTTIKRYSAPSEPGKPTISYSKSRFTVTENWTVSWAASTAMNNNSPVIGYRIRVYVNGKTIPFKKSNGTVRTTDTGKDNASRYYYNRLKTDTNITLYPKIDNLKPGDQVYVTVCGLTIMGNGLVKNSTAAKSDTLTIQHAGIMHTKVSDAWKEGQVYVNVSGTWKEADVVYTKVSNAWKESE